MTIDRGFELRPSAQIDAEGKFVSGQNPFEMHGIHHFPATRMHCGVVARHNGDQLVQLLLVCTSPIGNSLGSFMRMTPQGARELAGYLLAHAIEVEAHVEAQAAAAIEAARLNGGAR